MNTDTAMLVEALFLRQAAKAMQRHADALRLEAQHAEVEYIALMTRARELERYLDKGNENVDEQTNCRKAQRHRRV